MLVFFPCPEDFGKSEPFAITNLNKYFVLIFDLIFI